MVNKLAFAKRFLLPVTPLVAGSILAQLAVGIAASPSLATTLAFSEARFEIDNFSHNPLDVLTFTDTDTVTIATSGQVTADANAFATFINNPFESPFANNSSFSTTNGEGSNYSGLARSFAAVIGYNFFVEEGETFSFDFNSSLDLEASIDNPEIESAIANGTLSFNLYNSNDSNNMMLLDSFTISSNLNSVNGYSQDSQASTNITLNSDLELTSAGDTPQSASNLIDGQFSRYFDSSTDLTLIETKENEASVFAVPEPRNALGFILFGLISVGYKVRKKCLQRR